jgi:hypothetical protein
MASSSCRIAGDMLGSRCQCLARPWGGRGKGLEPLIGSSASLDWGGVISKTKNTCPKKHICFAENRKRISWF